MPSLLDILIFLGLLGASLNLEMLVLFLLKRRERKKLNVR